MAFRLGYTVGQHLVRPDGVTLIVRGGALYSMDDRSDGQEYGWEEWALVGLDEADAWLQYDHYSGEVTLYRLGASDVPPEMLFTALTMPEGQQVAGWRVDEVSTATVRDVVGRPFDHPLSPGGSYTYADLSQGRRRLSVEQYPNGSWLVYHGAVLNPADQRRVLGAGVPATAAPTSKPTSTKTKALGAAIVVALVAGLGGCFYSSNQTTCTPRSSYTAKEGDKITSDDGTRVCYRRPLFVGGGGK